jgi:tetratricopeptide (TPR) repeat protein
MRRFLISRLMIAATLLHPMTSRGAPAAPQPPIASEDEAVEQPKPIEPEINIQAEYKKALGFQKEGKLKDAFQVLKSLSKDETEKARAYLFIGSLYHQKKKYKKAKLYFDEAGDDIVLEKETAFAYGATYLEYEDLTKALVGLKAAAKFKSASPTAIRYKLGVTYFKLGQYSRAELYFEKIDPNALSTGLRLERQRYLLEIRARHDELRTSFTGQESEVRTVVASPRAFDNESSNNDWSAIAKEKEWGIRWRPGAMLHQESSQNLNRGNGRDASELLSHRVGTSAYAGGNASAKAFGSLEFGFGFTGFEVQKEHSRSFRIAGADGEFLSRTTSERAEEHGYFNFQPMLNLELSPAMRAEVGAGLNAYLPHFQMDQGWGQTEALVRLRAEGKDREGGIEVALQQPFDSREHETSDDVLVKGDYSERFGEVGVRVGAQHWVAGNDKFTAFSRERMSLVDNRFKYHLGFQTESKASVSASLNLGDLGLRATYEYTTRKSATGVERLSVNDDPELTSQEAHKRLLAAAFPLWDTVSLSAAIGMQSLKGYTFRLRDESTGAVLREYESDINQQILQLGCVVALVDWVKVRLTFAQGRNSYIGGTARDEIFELQNPRASENSLMHIELSKSF